VAPARGFTLLELIAVLVLIGMLLVFSPMVLDSVMSDKQLESEAARLGTMIEAMHTQAVLDQAEYAIHYDTEEHRWAVQLPEEVEEEYRGGEDREPVKALVLEQDVPPEELEWHRLPPGIRMELFEGRREIRKGRYMITFSPGGTVPAHAVILESNNISSLDEDERHRTIKVNVPGFVSFAPGRLIEDFKLTEAEIGR
jgi:prepilin-type N-terminal cleavage/methylation domain-containing protein